VLLVLRSALDSTRPAFALRVDDVLTVLDVPRDRMHPAPEGFARFAPWVSRIVECSAVGGTADEAVLVQMLDCKRLAGATGADLSLQNLAPEVQLEALA